MPLGLSPPQLSRGLITYSRDVCFCQCSQLQREQSDVMVPETVKNLQQSTAEQEEKARNEEAMAELQEALDEETKKVASMADRMRRLELDLEDVPLIR